MSRDTHRCCSLSVSSSPAFLPFLSHITTPSPVSLPPPLCSLFLFLSFSISYLLFRTPFVYSSLSSLNSLLHSHPLSLSIYFLPWHLFNSLSLSLSFSFHMSFVLSYSLSNPPPPLAPRLAVALPSIIFRCPRSFTFIVIPVCSMMKRWSPQESP